MARGINSSLSLPSLGGMGGLSKQPRGPGRPPKIFTGVVPPERRCQADGCSREARSKGLCSAHYQAERRKHLLKQGRA
ncbi:MAG: hypothetical protein ACT4TC_03085 [Myxococcaceae bacterium]